jgi:hypothetical protein
MRERGQICSTIDTIDEVHISRACALRGKLCAFELHTHYRLRARLESCGVRAGSLLGHRFAWTTTCVPAPAKCVLHLLTTWGHLFPTFPCMPPAAKKAADHGGISDTVLIIVYISPAKRCMEFHLGLFALRTALQRFHCTAFQFLFRAFD